jgi:hypothetical protein
MKADELHRLLIAPELIAIEVALATLRAVMRCSSSIQPPKGDHPQTTTRSRRARAQSSVQPASCNAPSIGRASANKIIAAATSDEIPF